MISEPLNITVSDVGYIFEEIWNGRSALSGNLNKLTLTSKYTIINNLYFYFIINWNIYIYIYIFF